MTIRKMTLAVLGITLGACGDSDDTKTPTGVSSVTGALSDGSQAASVSAIQVQAVADDGSVTVVGHGTVQSSGAFTITNIAVGDGPFIVRAVGSGDSTIAAAILPQDLASGQKILVVPLDAETSVEAQALLSILASTTGTDRAAAGVDTIGLMTWVSADLAADAASPATAAKLGASYMMAQDAWLATANAEDSATHSAAKVEAAKVGAFGTLTSDLKAATTANARATAWASFRTRALADVAASLTLDAGAQADAETAAGLVFTAGLESAAASHLGALRQAAIASAYADLNAERAAATHATAVVAVDAKLEASFEVFLAAAAAATTEAGIKAASTDLAAAVSGRGSATPATSALSLLVAGESTDDVAAMAAVETALDATADEATTLRASVAAALALPEAGRAAAVAAAYATFRADLDVAVTDSLGGSLGAAVGAFTSEVAAQARGHLGALVGVDLLGTLGDFSLSLSGLVDVGIAFQDDGAIGLLPGHVFDALGAATSAVLVTVGADGSSQTIATGTIDATNHRFAFDAVTGATGTLVVELRRADGSITGAAILDGTFATTGAYQVATITEDSTVEAKVVLARVARGEAQSTIDRASLELMVDAAIAGATTTEADVQALASASFAAETVRAMALGTSPAVLAAVNTQAMTDLHLALRENPAGADAAYAAFRESVAANFALAGTASVTEVAAAQAEAALVFEAVIAHRHPGTLLANVTEAHTRIEAAFALATAVGATFEGSSFGSVRETQLTDAVAALVTATTVATSETQIEVAASGFADALLGLQVTTTAATGVVGKMTQSDLGLTAVQMPSIQAAVTQAFTAAATFQASLDAAVATADGATAFDATAFGAAWTTAWTTFTLSLASALDFSALTTVSAGDATALQTLMTHLVLSFSSASDGMPAGN